MLRITFMKTVAIVTALVFAITMFTGLTFAEGTELPWPEVSGGLQMPFRPQDKTVSLQNPPDFSWPHIGGADQYHLQVSRRMDMAEISHEGAGLATNFYNFPAAFEAGTWYWRVRYHKAEGWSEWTAPRRFRMDENAVPFPVPTVDDMISRVSAGHPRIWTNSSTLDTFRSYAQTKGKSVYDAKYASVMGNLNKPLPAEPVFPYGPDAPKDAAYIAALGNLHSYSNAAVDSMLNAAFVYLISGDAQIGQNTKAQLLNIASWNPDGATSYATHDQVHRAIAYKSAMAYDWCYDLLTPDERQNVVNMVTVRTNTMANDILNAHPINVNPYDSHGWTAFGYIGIISVALLHEVPDAAQWFRKVTPAYINILPPWGGEDGGWAQGTGYWQWSTLFNKEFMDVLLRACNMNLYDKAFSRNEGYFPLYAFPNGSPKGGFGDDSEYAPGPSNVTVYKRLAEMYKDPVMQWGYKTLNSPPYDALYDYFYGDTSIPSIPPVALPPARWFRDIGWVAMHSNLYDPRRVSFYFKSSPYGSFNHSHADQNSFIINAFSETLALDSGYYDWYASNHDLNYSRQTFAHNAVTYDGKNGQSTFNLEAKGKITGFASHPDFDSASGDAAGAYMGSLSKADRHVIYIRPDMFVMVDNLASPKAGGSEYSWWLHAEEQLDVDADQAGATIVKGMAALKTRIHYPQQMRAVYEERFLDINGIEVRPEGRFATKPDQKHASFTTPKAESTTIVSTMDVYRRDEVPQNVISENMGNYLKLIFEDETQVFVRLAHEGEVDTGALKFDGAAAAVKGNTVLLVSGTKLVRDGIVLIQSSQPSTAVFGKEQLSISSQDDAAVGIYAPGTVRVRNENGADIPQGGNIADSLALRGVHWETQGDTLALNLDKGAHSFKMNNSPIPQPLDDVQLNVEISGQTGMVRLKAHSDAWGNSVAWGSLNNTEGLYEVLEAPQGLVFEKHGRPKIVFLEKNASVIVAGDAGVLRLREAGAGAKTAAEVKEDYDFVKDICTTWKEAESFTATGGGSFSVYNTRPFLSGGIGVGNWVSKSQWIKWVLNVPKKGKYDLVLKYVAGWGLQPGEVTKRIAQIGSSAYSFEAPSTVDWGTKPQNWRALRVKTATELEPGSVEISVWNALGPMNLDWVGLIEIKDDEIPPSAPGNLRLVSKDGSTAVIAWAPSTDNAGIRQYDIFKDGVMVDTTTDGTCTYEFGNLTAAQQYDFTVKARDLSDNVSKASNVLSVSTDDLDAPVWDGAALNAALIYQNMVRLAWSEARDNSAKIREYELYRIDGESAVKIASVSGTMYDVLELEPGKTYKFKIEAVDMQGNRSDSGPGVTVKTLSYGDSSGGGFDTFDNEPAGAMTSRNGWTINNYYGSASIEEIPGSSNKYLKLVDNDYDNTTVSNEYRYAIMAERKFGPVSGKVVFETKFMFNRLNHDYGNFLIEVYGGSQTVAKFIGFSGGTFGYRTSNDPATSRYIPAKSAYYTLPRDQWVTLRMELDTNAKTYDLTFTADALKTYTGAVDSPATLDRINGIYKVSGIPFFENASASSIDAVRLNASRYTGVYSFDDVTMYKKDILYPAVTLAVPGHVNMSGEFDVDIGLQNVTGISAQDIALNYDKNLFEFVGAQSMREGSVILQTFNNADNGILRFIIANTGKNNAIDGEAQLLKLKFKTKGVPGTGNIGISMANIADKSGVETNINSLPARGVIIKDLVAPTITVEGVAEGQVYNESVTPVVKAEDFDSGLKSLKVTVDGQEWTQETAVKQKGPHKLKAVAVDNAGNTATVIVNFVVYYSTTLNVDNASSIYSDVTQLKAVLSDKTGNPVAGETVVFTVDGTSVGTAVTNIQGIAVLNYKSNIGAGPDAETLDHEVGAVFAQNDGTYYRGSEETGVLTAGKEEASITYMGTTVSPVELAVTLAANVLQQEDGNPGDVGGLPVQFTISRVNPNGTLEAYSDTLTQKVYRTDESGKVSVDGFLPAGFYKVRVNLLKNSFYKAAETIMELAVYDAAAGEVEANGWFALTEKNTIMGSKAEKVHLETKWGYNSNTKMPEGKLRIHAEPQGLRLEMNTAEWLVIEGTHAYVQGTAQDAQGTVYTVRLMLSDPATSGKPKPVISLVIWKGNGTRSTPVFSSTGQVLYGEIKF